MPEYTPTPDDLKLAPFLEVLAIAKVTETDRERVARDWRDNPPDKAYDGLLDAVIMPNE